MALLLISIATAARFCIRGRCLPTFLSVVAATVIAVPAARGDIIRWDNGQRIPGTEGIVPGPGAQLNSFDLAFADLSDKNLIGASFEGSNLTSARMMRSNLANVNLSGTNLSNSNFTPVSLTGANFEGALVYGATFNRPNGFVKEQLYSTASFQANDLRGFKLLFHDISGWDFSGQDLTGALFFITQFADVDLSGATIREAALLGATDYGLVESRSGAVV